MVAYLLNNTIEGHLSCNLSNKVFKFHMSPLMTKDWVQKVDLNEEIKRISLEFEMVGVSEYGFKINISKKRF